MTKLNVNISVPFPSPREAEIAYQVLKVDSEPKRSDVTKILSVNGNILKATFSGTEARKIRVGLTCFFDNLTLVSETMKEFGPPESSYSHY